MFTQIEREGMTRMAKTTGQAIMNFYDEMRLTVAMNKVFPYEEKCPICVELHEAGLRVEAADNAAIMLEKHQPDDLWHYHGPHIQHAYEELKKKDIEDPKYYTQHLIEAIDVTEAWELSYSLGCVMKYIARHRSKHENPVQDLEKAAWHLNREIERLLRKEIRENGKDD